MFKYKPCENCGHNNHHKNIHCNKCGKILANIAVFSTKSLAVTIVLLLALGSSTVLARSFFSQEPSQVTQNEISITPQPVIQTPTPTPSPTLTPTPTPTPAATSTPSPKTKSIPQAAPSPRMVATPTPSPIAVCDTQQKELFTTKFKVGYNQALKEMKEQMSPNNTPDEDKPILDEYLAKVKLFYLQYQQDMKGINCPAEQLVGGLIPS